MTFVGLDLHKRYVTVCALDAGGAVLAEVRQMTVYAFFDRRFQP